MIYYKMMDDCLQLLAMILFALVVYLHMKKNRRKVVVKEGQKKIRSTCRR
jgi:hypothetical protein